MTKLIRAVCGALMLAMSAPGLAHKFAKGDLRIGHPWTRATAHGQTVAAGYLVVRNEGKETDRMVGASTPAAERIELHILAGDGEVMKMRQVQSFDLPPGGGMEFKPRGPHLMIIGIRRPFAKDERIPVTLKFEKAGDVAIELVVSAIDGGPEHDKH